MSKDRKHTVAMVVSCIHLPFVLKPAWNLFLQAIDIIQPDMLIVNGDGVDFAGLHSKNKVMRDEACFEEQELEPTREYLDEMESVIPGNCRKIWIEGNHEHFWYNYCLRNAAIMPAKWYKALGLQGWSIHEYVCEEMPVMRIGDLIITHGSTVRRHSGWSAKAELERRWDSILMGHTHRMGSYFFTPADTGVVYSGYEIGCLADQTTARKYMRAKPNWQHGFAVVSFDKRSGWFDVSLKRISRMKGKNVYRLGLHEGVIQSK